MEVLAAFGSVLVFIGMSGGLGVPLGVPPMPEDPVLAQVAPEECLFYASWSGMAPADPKSGNKTERLFAEPEVRRMFDELDAGILGLIETQTREKPADRAVMDGLYGLVKTVLTRPTAIFLTHIKPKDGKPDFRGAMVVSLGPDAAKTRAAFDLLVKRAKEEEKSKVDSVTIGGQAWTRIKTEGPDIVLGFRGDYLIAGFGTGSVEDVLARWGKPAPAWHAAIAQQAPVPRRSTVCYVNIAGFTKTIDAFLKEKITGGLDAVTAKNLDAALQLLGLKNAKALVQVSGLDSDGATTRTVLLLDGPPRGMLASLTAKPLTAADLAPIPRDATYAFAFRLNLKETLDGAMEELGKSDPSAAKELHDSLETMERDSGIDLRRGLLSSLGDTWCVYSAPSEGSFIITGLTVVVPLKNLPSFTQAFHQATNLAKRSLGGEQGPQLRTFNHNGKTVFWINAGMFAPAWCIADNNFVFAVSPQNVKSYLSRGNRPSLAEVPQVAQLLKADAPAAMVYCDAAKLVETLYPFATLLAPAVSSLGGSESGGFDVSLLPSMRAVLPHFGPETVIVRRTPAGIEVVARRTLPEPGLTFLTMLLSGSAVSGPVIVPAYSKDPLRTEEATPTVVPTAPAPKDAESIPHPAPVPGVPGIRVGPMPPSSSAPAPAVPVQPTLQPQPLGSATTAPSYGSTAPLYGSSGAPLLPSQTYPSTPAVSASAPQALGELGEAVTKYVKANGTLPPAYIADKDGMPLLSWRVAMLPYLGKENIYQQFDRNKPWNVPPNRLLMQCRSFQDSVIRNVPDGWTDYVAIVGPQTAMTGKEGVRLADISDGPENTILFVLVDRYDAVPWTKPADVRYDELHAPPTSPYFNMYALFCDGKVRMLPATLDTATFRALATRNGGEKIDVAALERKALEFAKPVRASQPSPPPTTFPAAPSALGK